MGRHQRAAVADQVYHVLNRANARMTIFEKPEDYDAFERVLEEAVERTKTRLLSYCVMPNHWHLVVWPREDDELSRFVGWLTLTHTRRWHAHRRSTGTGHVYQGRFKSFPVQEDDHLLTVCRYVERNALRADLVSRAEGWKWNSLHRWKFGDAKERSLLSAWPLPRKSNWLEFVNKPQTDAELEAVRRSVHRGRPYGEPTWSEEIAGQLGLESTFRPIGRPRSQKNGS